MPYSDACQVSRIVIYPRSVHIFVSGFPPVVDPTAGSVACGWSSTNETAVRAVALAVYISTTATTTMMDSD